MPYVYHLKEVYYDSYSVKQMMKTELPVFFVNDGFYWFYPNYLLYFMPNQPVYYVRDRENIDLYENYFLITKKKIPDEKMLIETCFTYIYLITKNKL